MIALYAAVGFSEAASGEARSAIWQAMLASDILHVAVVPIGGAIVATAALITAPNLLRGGRRHAFLENVATHPDRQGCGHGRAVVGHLLQTAWQAGCHHVLLQSGRPDPRVHRFYADLGFEAGRRTGYVVHRPTRYP